MVRVVAVTCDRRDGQAWSGPTHGRVRPPRAEVFVHEAIVRALRTAGLEPWLLPPHDGEVGEWIAWVVERAGAVVLTGGPVDLHPSLYGEAVEARLDKVDPGRASLELGLARAALAADLPLLGVCGGLQTLAVAAGGTLVQDIATQVRGALEHEQPTDPATPWHEVHLLPGHLRRAYGCDRIQVNSTHHQAVKSPGSLTVTGRAPDGVVEAVEHPSHRFCVGVQWHPEHLDPTPFVALGSHLR